jgi:hypothetical protein
MATVITFALGALTVAWDTADDLETVLHKAGMLRVALEAQAGRTAEAPARPAGPSRNPAPYVPPATAAEAEQRFFAKYGETVGANWPAVQRWFGHLLPRPKSIEEWIAVAEEVKSRQRAAA